MFQDVASMPNYMNLSTSGNIKEHQTIVRFRCGAHGYSYVSEVKLLDLVVKLGHDVTIMVGKTKRQCAGKSSWRLRKSGLKRLLSATRRPGARYFGLNRSTRSVMMPSMLSSTLTYLPLVRTF